MEYHANVFACLILMPDTQLDEQIRRFGEIQKDPVLREETEAHHEFLTVFLSDAFEVSTEAVLRRLKKRNQNRR